MTNRGHHLHAESHSSSCMLGSCSPITMSLLLNSAAKQSTHAFFPRVRFLVNLGTSMWPCRPWSSYPIADWRTALQFAMLGWSHWNPMHRAKANATKADERNVQKYWIRSSSTRLIRSETPSQHVMAFCLVLEWVNSCHGPQAFVKAYKKRVTQKRERLPPSYSICVCSSSFKSPNEMPPVVFCHERTDQLHPQKHNIAPEMLFQKSLSTSSNHHFQGAMSRLLVFGNVSPLRFWRLQLQLFGCM